MSQWKIFIVTMILLVGFIPTASSQAAVAYSMSFTNGQVQLDVRPGAGFHSEVEFTSLIRNETNSSLEEYETLQYSNNENITGNNKIFSIIVTVDWEMNYAYWHDFSVSLFNQTQVSNQQTGNMQFDLQVNENLTMDTLAWGEFLNESEFENSFLRIPPSLDVEFSFTPNNYANDSAGGVSNVVFNVTTEIITWKFTEIMPASRGCTEMVISNEGQATIDVDVYLSGGGVTISPAMVSVTLAPGGSVTKEICAHALKMVSYKTVQVNALGSGRETNTQLNQVNKNAGFAVIVQQFAKLSLAPDKLVSDVCLGKDSDVHFTVVNLGNYQDTVAMEITNLQFLEESGFTITLPGVQYNIDSGGEQSVKVIVSSTELGNNSILNFRASTTLQGETAFATNFTHLNVIECQNEDSDTGSEFAPIATVEKEVVLSWNNNRQMYNISVDKGQTVQFSGTGTDVDGVIVKYEWDFYTDGVYEWSSEENGLTTFIYNEPGRFTATFRVTDNDGNTATDTFVVNVKPGPEDINDSGYIPSISIITSLILVGLLAIFRKK